MKRILSIALLSATTIACSNENGPNCSDELVKSLVKEIFMEETRRDTSDISVLAIRTISKNNEYNSCECAANVVAEENEKYYEINQSITYNAQTADDGESIVVTIHDEIR